MATELTHCPHCGKSLAQTVHTAKHMAPVVNVKAKAAAAAAAAEAAKVAAPAPEPAPEK